MNKQSIIRFGHYPFDANGKQADIEWLILDEQNTNNGKEILLLSRYILDAAQFDEALYTREYTPSPSNEWATSSLRRWLNRTFLHLAFREDEQNRIVPTHTVTNTSLVTNPKRNAPDKVFLLSVEEARQYLRTSNAPTSPYAEESLVDVYWLRNATIPYGGVACGGKNSNVMDLTVPPNRVFSCSPEEVAGIRPALRIML